MSERLYLLDTNVLLLLVRGGALGFGIDARYGLRSMKQRPFVSIVSHGEIRVIAKRNGWGKAKLLALQHALDGLVTIDINRPAVIDAYVELELVSVSRPVAHATWARTTSGSPLVLVQPRSRSSRPMKTSHISVPSTSTSRSLRQALFDPRFHSP